MKTEKQEKMEAQKKTTNKTLGLLKATKQMLEICNIEFDFTSLEKQLHDMKAKLV